MTMTMTVSSFENTNPAEVAFGPDRWTVDVERPMIGSRVVAVRVTAKAYGSVGRYEALGFAKRHPADDDDPEIGRCLALSRALHKLADQLETGARLRIR